MLPGIFNFPDHHFAGAGKMIILGKGGERQVSNNRRKKEK